MTISVLFLNAPPLCRVVVLVMVPFNAWAEIKLATSMSYITMTVLILAIVASKFVIFLTKRDAFDRVNTDKLAKVIKHISFQVITSLR